MKSLPTPLEILLDPISLIVIAMYLALMLWEKLLPGRSLDKMKYWYLRGFTMFVFYFYLSSYFPLFWDPFLSRIQLFDFTSLNVVVSTLIGVFLYEFGVYVWHRSMHKNNILWRVFHQMHHSVERVDIPSAFYFSPWDMMGWTFLGSLCFSFIGFPPQAITLTILITTFLGLFQHANIKTPQWMGYFIQRPESHTVHHAKDIHAYNYSDLPIFDILFGTFKNPKGYEYEIGFYNGASMEIGKMLSFQDVTKPSTTKSE
jgi:sterol desaturase/sphingolipid hydroxylase (fatty acid hydroxylase superfamily)